MKVKQYSEDTFQQDVKEIISTRYSARTSDVQRRFGRFHVAIKILLSEYGIDDEDITDSVVRDNHDKGIDYFYVAEGSSTLYAIQVKDHAKLSKQPQMEAVLKLAEAVRFLRNCKKKHRGMSELEKERFDQLNEAECKPEHTRYMLLLTGGAQPKISKKDFSTDAFQPSESLEIHDIASLVKKAKADLAPPSQDVEISVDQDKVIEVNYGTAPKTLITYVKAQDYVKATESLGADIFRINPRLYLGQKSKYNAGMLATLSSADTREKFHLLNNGITAVCKNYVQSKGVIKIEGFQVVNGCQTTETLWKFHGNSPDESGDVYVMLKIIATGESEDFARRISATTNSQTAINSIDLVANDPCHQLIKDALNSGSHPCFYISKRGEWEKVTASQRERYKVSATEWGENRKGGTCRKIALKELAQAFVAVCLNPASAKEQITSLFNSRGQDSNYSKLFDKGRAWSEPSQVILLAYLHAYITSGAWIDTENADQNLYDELATLGRFYIIHLVYNHWRDKFRDTGNTHSNPKLLSPEASAEILSNFLNEVGVLPDLATNSLIETKLGDEDAVAIDSRHLLRNSEHKHAIERCFKRHVKAYNSQKHRRKS